MTLGLHPKFAVSYRYGNISLRFKRSGFEDPEEKFNTFTTVSPSDLTNSDSLKHIHGHDRNTRNKDYLNVPSYQSAAGQRTFLYRVTKLWNSLPREVTPVDSLRTFKKKLREFLFESFLVS